MKKLILLSQSFLLIGFMIYSLNSHAQDNSDSSDSSNTESSCLLQISAYVNDIYQDSKGAYWFGTHGHGVCRFNPSEEIQEEKDFKYFSTKEGVGGVNVRKIVEDKAGNIWFATTGGLTQFDGNTFTNFTEEDGLINNDIWSLAIDQSGIIWIGTMKGVSRFDAGKKTFTSLAIPKAQLDYEKGITSTQKVHCIMEDSQGQIWFGTNGGAYIYDGHKLSNISEKDGLNSNAVTCLLEEKNGNIWFGTHSGGLSKYNGKSFTHFNENDDVKGREVWSLYEDKMGNIWFSAVGFGAYKYDGTSFTHFYTDEGLDSQALHCFTEDKLGRLWVGGWKGVYRLGDNAFERVTQNGPW